MADDSNHRISLSEERLRAALAEMELRLRVYFDTRLEDIRISKANQVDVTLLAQKLDALDRGDFTDVHKRALTEFMEEHASAAEGKQWTKNERWFGAIAVFLSVIAVSTSIFFGAKSIEGDPAPEPQKTSQEVAPWMRANTAPNGF